MVRVIFALIGVGALAALGAWLLEDGMVDTLLKVSVGIILVMLIGAVPITLLQRFSPSEAKDE